MRWTFVFAAVLIALVSSAVVAADDWIGKQVFLKDGAKAKVGQTRIDIAVLGSPATVGNVNGDWLWVERAWVRKADVMLSAQALSYYTEQIRRNPSSAKHWVHRAAVWQTIGEFDNAIKDYTEAIRFNPSYPPAYDNRGKASMHQGDLDSAIRDFTEAIRLNPKQKLTYSNRGGAFAIKGNYANAVADLENAISLDPNYVDALANLAELYSCCPDPKVRDGQKAMALAKRACELSGWNALINLHYLACAYAETEDFLEAIQWEQKAIELTHPTKRKNLEALNRALESFRENKAFHELVLFE